MTDGTDAARATGDAVRADTVVMATYAREAASLAERLHDAAARTRLGDPGGLGTTLGPVGAAFLAVLAATHDAHVRDLDRVGDRLAGTGTATAAAAAAYETSSHDTSARLRAAAEGL